VGFHSFVPSLVGLEEVESQFVGQNWSIMAMSCNSNNNMCGSSLIMNAIPFVSKSGNEPCFVSRLGGSQKKLCGLETRTMSNGLRKRACAIRTAKSGSVDASTDTSRGMLSSCVSVNSLTYGAFLFVYFVVNFSVVVRNIQKKGYAITTITIARGSCERFFVRVSISV